MAGGRGFGGSDERRVALKCESAEERLREQQQGRREQGAGSKAKTEALANFKTRNANATLLPLHSEL